MICDTCVNYVYDEDWECYTCMVNMDEDDYGRSWERTVLRAPFSAQATSIPL